MKVEATMPPIQWTPEYASYMLVVAAFGFALRMMTMAQAQFLQVVTALVANSKAQTELATSVQALASTLTARMDHLEADFCKGGKNHVD